MFTPPTPSVRLTGPSTTCSSRLPSWIVECCPVVETSEPTIRIDEDERVTDTPSSCTGEGRRLSTERTLDCTSLSASTGSTLSSKVRVMTLRPVEDEDSVYSSPSRPVSASSMGVVTLFCTARAVAPE